MNVSRRHQPSHAVRRKVDIEVDNQAMAIVEGDRDTVGAAARPAEPSSPATHLRSRRRRDGLCIDCRKPLPTLLASERRFDRCLRCRKRVAELTALRRLKGRALYDAVVALSRDESHAGLLADLIAASRVRPRWKYQREAAQ